VGIIIDKDRGMVLVDRASVPMMAGLVELTIAGEDELDAAVVGEASVLIVFVCSLSFVFRAGSLTVPANIVFLHPYQAITRPCVFECCRHRLPYHVVVCTS
jgi:hypothetical protein